MIFSVRSVVRFAGGISGFYLGDGCGDTGGGKAVPPLVTKFETAAFISRISMVHWCRGHNLTNTESYMYQILEFLIE